VSVFELLASSCFELFFLSSDSDAAAFDFSDFSAFSAFSVFSAFSGFSGAMGASAAAASAFFSFFFFFLPSVSAVSPNAEPPNGFAIALFQQKKLSYCTETTAHITSRGKRIDTAKGCGAAGTRCS
jgi:hypothetical protein